MRKKLDGILFDLDGTLWDSSRQVAVSWNETLKRYPKVHRELDERDIRGIMGLQVPEIAGKLFPDLDRSESVELVTKCCREECAHLVRTGGVLFEGLKETLEHLSKEYPLFIISNCLEGYIESFLEYHKTASYFQDFLAAGATGKGKAYNIKKMMEQYTLQRCIYVGDTAGDQQAAKEAGIPFVYAVYGFGTVHAPCHKLEKFSDLPDLIKRIEEIMK